MMQLFFNSYSSKEQNNERGAVLILVMFVVVIIFAMAGLAVDSGNLYHSQIQLQKAVDTGALAGIGSTFMNDGVPPTGDPLKAYIINMAEETLEENLTAQGFDLTDIDHTVDYDLTNHTLSVEAKLTRKLFLMHAVPFGILGIPKAAEFIDVNASAEIKRKPANIALVLDLSDSMDCPSVGDCICKTSDRDITKTCDEIADDRGVNRRVEDLRVAIEDFVAQFDPTYDRINLVAFKLGANVLVPLKADGSRGFTLTDFDIFDTVDPSSSTNPSDGLISAFTDYKTHNIPGNEEIAYVLFSDGAPTAARFLFASQKAALNPNNEFGQGNYDYLSYSVQWQDPNTGDSWAGPSPLVKNGAAILWDQSTTEAPPGFIPDCVSSVPNHVPVSSPAIFNQVFSDCLNNMSFHVPGDNTIVYGNQISDTGSKTYANNWQEQYYNSVVALSDSFRNSGGYVFTIGLGEQRNLAEDIANSDPYQNISDVLLRKDILLSRAANDIIQARPVDANGVALTAEDHPEFDFQGYQKFDDIKALTNPRYGRYFPTPDSTELKDIFRSISQKILLRITK